MNKKREEYFDTGTALHAISTRLTSENPADITILAEGLHNKNAILPDSILTTPLPVVVQEIGTATEKSAIDLIVSSFRYVEIETTEAIITLRHHARWKRFKDLIQLPKENRSSEDMLTILKEQQEENRFWEQKPWRK